MERMSGKRTCMSDFWIFNLGLFKFIRIWDICGLVFGLFQFPMFSLVRTVNKILLVANISIEVW
jgi:hypothetical protein